MLLQLLDSLPVFLQSRVDRVQPQAIRHTATNHQCADEPWTGRIGHSVRALYAGLIQHLLHQRQKTPYMVARGYFRHYAAVDGVQVNLTVQRIRQQAGFGAVQGYPGLITTGFNA